MGRGRPNNIIDLAGSCEVKININSGGGGVVVGDGGVASGVGSSISIQSGAEKIQFDKADLGDLLASLAVIKSELAFSDSSRRAEAMGRIAQMEEALLERPGAVSSQISRGFLSYLGATFSHLSGVVGACAKIASILKVGLG